MTAYRALGFLLALAAVPCCASNNGGTGDGRDGGNADGASGTGPCSSDGSDAIVFGTYETPTSSTNLDAVVYVLVRDGCRYCATAYSTQEHTLVSQGTRWSSAWAADKSTIVVSFTKADGSIPAPVTISANGAEFDFNAIKAPRALNVDWTCDGLSAPGAGVAPASDGGTLPDSSGSPSSDSGGGPGADSGSTHVDSGGPTGDSGGPSASDSGH